MLVKLSKSESVILYDSIHTALLVFFHAVSCQFTTHVKMIIPRITPIADFEQRWRQRGKATDRSFNLGHWELSHFAG